MKPTTRFVLRDRTRWTLITPRPVPNEVVIMAAKNVLPDLQRRAVGNQRTAVEWLGLKVQYSLTAKQCEQEGIGAAEVHDVLRDDPGFKVFLELSKTYSIGQARS